MARLTGGCLVTAWAWECGLLADLGVTDELCVVRGVEEGVREVREACDD